LFCEQIRGVITVLMVYVINIIFWVLKLWTFYHEVQATIYRDFLVTTVVGHVMDTPWSWRFFSSTAVPSWRWGVVFFWSRCQSWWWGVVILSHVLHLARASCVTIISREIIARQEAQAKCLRCLFNINIFLSL
jgi:hypothetical protein